MRLSSGGRLNRKQKVMNWIKVSSRVTVKETENVVTCTGWLSYTIGQDPEHLFEFSRDYQMDGFTVQTLADWQALFNKALTKQLYQFID